CDSYAIEDSRINVIHKVNGGLSDARNAGLSVCEGDFVAFVDSDDIIHPRFIETLYENIGEGDFVFCNIARFEDQNKPDWISFPPNQIKQVYGNDEVFSNFYKFKEGVL